MIDTSPLASAPPPTVATVANDPPAHDHEANVSSHRDPKQRNREAQRAQQTAQLEQLFADLGVDTGDVVIFDRKCTSMNLYGGAICVTAKFFGRTQWDHNGVVIRDPATGQLLFLEAALTGVKMRPLVERVLRSKSYEVAVRKLQVHRTPEFQARAFEFATEILNSPYEDRPQRLLNAGVPVPPRVERERLFHALIAEKKELERLDSEITHRLHMPAFERNALVQARDAAHERYHRLVDELRETERSVFENELLDQPTQKRKMFCSQLVASLYQHLGLLLPYPSANSYLPKHFSTGDTSQYLKLHQDATLLPEISLRKELEANAERQRRLVHEAADRAPQDDTETSTIVTCLQRHPLFHTLTESELQNVATQFRRRELDDGEVVFYQGETGEYFYIIEDGECDVFVDYNYLRETRTEEEQANLSPTEVSPATLRRRKTLAMADFTSSSSQIGKNQAVLVATNGPGSAFGDSALIYESPRRATIRAKASKSKVVLWQLDKAAFKRIVDEHPSTQCSLEESVFLMKALSDHPLFAELDDRAKALAVRKCFPFEIKAGTTILNQGDSGDYFYVIESGKCEIVRQKPHQTSPSVDRQIGKGSSFGEAALLYNSRRGASVRALEDTKLWCMDRATFVTITRSGSSALFKMFQKVSSSKKDDGESFLTQRDLHRLLRAPRHKDLIVHDASSSRTPPSRQALDRARRLAHSLLFHDASGLVNFSQFAHFHIALGASTNEQVLPEAAFRILNELAGEVSGQATEPNQSSAIRVREISKLMQLWRETDLSHDAQSLRSNVPEAEVEAMETLFMRSLALPTDDDVGEYRVTCDDMARVLANLTYDSQASNEDISAAVAQVLAFCSTLKDDLDVLRNLWRAAEFRAGGHIDEEFTAGKKALTFDANLRSGWISAIRQNPTAGDWGSPEALGASDEVEESVESRKQQLLSHATSIVAAIGAGGLSRTVCAPLERLKILKQAGVPVRVVTSTSVPAPYSSMTRGFVNMIRLGGARSLFSGNLAHCLWVVPSLPTKFLLCDLYRSQLVAMQIFGAPSSSSSPRQQRYVADLQNLLAGGFAGFTVNSFLYPLDVVRGRLTVQQYDSPAKRPYLGIRDAFTKIRLNEPTRAFYRGFTPASMGVFSYIGCNYAIYEYLRPYFILYDTDMTGHQLGHPSIPGQILCATTASVASQTISYPFDLLRRRMQLGGAWHPQLRFPSYSSTWDCLKQTMRGHDLVTSNRWLTLKRITRLYQGLFVNSVKAVPSAVISFVSYEKIRELQAQGEDRDE